MGTLKNTSFVDKIKVHGQKVPSDLEDQYRDTATFHHKVDLADTPLDQTISIEVEAFCKDDPNTPCAKETLMVTRVDDGCLDVNAVYGLLVLPPSVITLSGVDVSAVSGWKESIPDQIYELVIKELRVLPMSGRIRHDPRNKNGFGGMQSSKGFRVYDVNQVYRIPNAQAWHDLGKDKTSIESVVENLQHWRKRKRRTGAISLNPQEGVDPSQIDLVLYGHIQPDYKMKLLVIEFMAVDVSDGVELKFVERHNPLLADIYFKVSNLSDGIVKLVRRIGIRLPRVCATSKLDENDKRSLRINLGANVGLFRRMELWIYARDAEINPKLLKLFRGDISNVESFSSWIECKEAKTSSWLQDDTSRWLWDDIDDVVITK